MNIIKYVWYLSKAYLSGHKISFIKIDSPIIHDCDEQFKDEWIKKFGSLAVYEKGRTDIYSKCLSCNEYIKSKLNDDNSYAKLCPDCSVHDVKLY